MNLTFEEKIQAYTVFLHESAKNLGCIFLEDAGEGHDLLTDTMYLEDVSGWLCPIDTPEKDRKNDEFYCFAEWKIVDNKPVIDFVKYKIYDV